MVLRCPFSLLRQSRPGSRTWATPFFGWRTQHDNRLGRWSGYRLGWNVAAYLIDQVQKLFAGNIIAVYLGRNHTIPSDRPEHLGPRTFPTQPELGGIGSGVDFGRHCAAACQMHNKVVLPIDAGLLGNRRDRNPNETKCREQDRQADEDPPDRSGCMHRKTVFQCC